MLKKAVCAALVLLALGFAAYFFMGRPNENFSGDRVVSAGPARFYLSFRAMNTEDAETLTLQEGDALHVSWQIDDGRVDVLIAMQGEEPLYQANGRGNGDAAAFDLTIPKSGAYTISVTGKNAKGWLNFEEK